MASSSFFGGNPTPVELADLDALVSQVEATAAVVAEGVSDASQSALEAAGHASTASAAASTTAGSQAAAEAAATNANTDRIAAQTARAGAETARNQAETYRNASYDDSQLALAYRNTTLTYRNDAQGFRNEAEGFKNAAAASAAAAATFNPANFYTKTEADGLLNLKAPRTSPAFAGVATFDARPTFNTFTPWDNGNLPATNDGKAILNAADAKAVRSLIQVDKDWSDVTTATNAATVSATESGKGYLMPLSAGVQVLVLPSTTGLPAGFTVKVLTTGQPAGYLTSYITTTGGKQIIYRSYANAIFYLIGRGEAFKFIWMPALDLWVAELIAQPSEVRLYRTHSYSGYGSGSTSWTPLSFETNSGDVSLFSLPPGGPASVPVMGVYRHNYRCYFYSSNGASMQAYMIPVNTGNAIDSSFGYSSMVILGGTASYLSLEWTSVLAPGQYTHAHYLCADAALQIYYANNAGHITMISR